MYQQPKPPQPNKGILYIVDWTGRNDEMPFDNPHFAFAGANYVCFTCKETAEKFAGDGEVCETHPLMGAVQADDSKPN